MNARRAPGDPARPGHGHPAAAGDRLLEAYAFCNAWNHDRLLPKAYATTTEATWCWPATWRPIWHTGSPAAARVLIDAVIATGVAFADAVERLP